MSRSSHDLLDLLGPSRARVLDALRAGPATVAEVAARLELSGAAVRRHVGELLADGLVAGNLERTRGRGRPHRRYGLTDKARRLYPDRSAEFANEALAFLQDSQGRPGVLRFLRWRQARQAQRYERVLDGVETPGERARELARLLDEDGYLADVVEGEDDAEVLQLRQGHCAIADVAADHPEICAYEAALFRRLLGPQVSLQRRRTLATGAPMCVCAIRTAADTTPSTTPTTTATTTATTTIDTPDEEPVSWR